ncbi:MAG TPA: transposase [Chloroflexota bacterium]|nr:transposase [Chloroflexota bacterium]
MAIVGGLDIHRRQITYDILDTDTGESCRGQLSPATRLELRAWLARFTGQQADFAFEGTTGWRFVAEELERAGFCAHLAEPADTRALRGPKRRAKTDRTDAHHLRELLRAGTLPASWMPPAHIADARTQVRLRRAWSASTPAGSSASTPSCSTTACPTAPSCSPPTGGPG